MAQTKGSPQYGETILVPETLLQTDATWQAPAYTQAALDWGPALAAADKRAIASGSNCIIVPPGTFAVASNQTITSDVFFQPNAQLSINSAITVTFNGTVDGPQTQIFAGSGTATLSGAHQLLTYGIWTGGSGVTISGNTTATVLGGGAIVPNALYISFPVYSAGSSTAIPSGFVVPNDGPTWKVAAVSYRYHVAGPASLTFNITADASGTAVGAGTAQLSAGADLHGIAADTVANGAIIASPTTLAAGATVSMTISSATQTGLASLQATVALQRVS